MLGSINRVRNNVLASNGFIATFHPHILLSLAALFWSGNFIAGRALRDDIDPISLNLIRWSLAVAVFAPFVWRDTVASWRTIRQFWAYIVALGATGIASFHTIVYVALKATTAINALLILSLAPALILAGSVIIDQRKASSSQWIGVVISLIGAGVVITRLQPDVISKLQLNSGDAWMLVAVLLWAAYSLLLKKRPNELMPDVALATSMLAGIALMMPAAVVSHSQLYLHSSPPTWLSVIYIALFASLVAFMCWTRGVAALGPANAGQFIHLMPVFGCGLSIILLDEGLKAAHVVGALVVLIGIVLVNRESSRA